MPSECTTGSVGTIRRCAAINSGLRVIILVVAVVVAAAAAVVVVVVIVIVVVVVVVVPRTTLAFKDPLYIFEGRC